MCGLVGYWDKRVNYDPEVVLTTMSDQIHYRGPDDSGIWVSSDHKIGIAHRRLSIIDLSENGHQPMLSPNKRYIIAFNGEIYNYQTLRKQLNNEGYFFKGNSDTEVLLIAIQAYGIKEAVLKCIGMFAFSLWDDLEKKLYLVRDRLGIKPLYYGIVNDCFFFSSELKPLLKHPKFSANIDHNALELYFRYNYVPAPYSIFSGINKLLPASIATISEDNITIDKYWNIDKYMLDEKSEIFDLMNFKYIVSEAVKMRMIADVPLGVFLSGGIDSTLVTAIMQEESHNPVSTFTVGFQEKHYNEAGYAKKIATYLGTNHHQLILSTSEAQSIIENIADIYDEPFADSSQIPTYLLAKFAKTKVKVCLSGDGGDETFAGYNRYLFANRNWETFTNTPKLLKKGFGKVLNRIKPERVNQINHLLSYVLPQKYHFKDLSNKIVKLASIMNCTNASELYNKLIYQWHQSPLSFEITHDALLPNYKWENQLNLIENMMRIDTNAYLPDDILTKLDRATMNVSLEARVPLLDYRVVEYAWKLPLQEKLSKFQTKIALRNLVYQYVPKKLLDRPKTGFGIPLDSWLRKDLKNWAQDLLSKDALKEHGLLDQEKIHTVFKQHLSGYNKQNQLWSALMFQAWYQNYFS